MDVDTASDLGLRERKAAQTRLAIAEALRARLAHHPLDAISADDLAADANVSRMTFFNYFPSKEQAVDYVMQLQLLAIERAIAAKGLTGLAALEQVFVLMGDELRDAPQRARRLFAHFAARDASRPLAPLGRADRLLLGAPTEASPAALGGLLMREIEVAQAAGELDPTSTSYELAHYLGSLFNGAAMVGHSSDDTDWPALFRRHFHRAVGLLGAPGQRDPKPPRVPVRYKSPSRKGARK